MASDNIKTIKVNTYKSQGYSNNEANKLANQDIRQQDADYRSYQQRRQYENADLKTQRQILDNNKKILEQERQRLEFDKLRAKNAAERKQLEWEIFKNQQEQFRVNEDIAKKERETIQRNQDYIRSQETIIEGWKTTKQIQEECNKIREEAKKREEEILKTQTDQKKAAKEIAQIHKESSDALKRAAESNKEMISKFGSDVSSVFGSKAGNIAQAFAQSKSDNSGLKGFLSNITGAGDKSKAISGIGEALTSMSGGSGFLGKAGNLLSGAAGKLSVVVTILQAIDAGLGAINKKLDEGINAAASDISEYIGKINSRLQGSSDSFGQITQYIKDNFENSPIINQQKLLARIASMVDTGLTYNLEERAVIGELSDRMVSTFDVMDKTLIRLSKIQGDDLTSASLGYEAQLTQFLNQRFQDTSYLTDLYDTVAGYMLEATASMGSADALAVTGNVQRWLGSLYSKGVSDSFITSIAEGIAQLGSGNVESLLSNSGLNNLFAVSSGGVYTDLMNGGFNYSNVNQLLQNVVAYLQGIASTPGNVTKRALSNAFGGASFADLRALSNLTTEDIAAISSAGNVASLQAMMNANTEFRNQMRNAATISTTDNLNSTDARNILATAMSNMVFNSTYQTGMDTVLDSVKYRVWALADELSVPLLSNVAKLFTNPEGAWNLVKSKVTSYTNSAEDMRSAFTDSNFYKKFAFNSAYVGSGSRGSQSFSGGKVGETNIDTTYSGVYSNGTGTIVVPTFTSISPSQTSVTGTTVSRDISELYAELFERQSTAIKVSLSKVDMDALNSLGNVINNNTKSSVGISGLSESVLRALVEYLHISKLDSIEDKLVNGKINVDSDDNLMSTINNGLAYMRGRY